MKKYKLYQTLPKLCKSNAAYLQLLNNVNKEKKSLLLLPSSFSASASTSLSCLSVFFFATNLYKKPQKIPNDSTVHGKTQSLYEELSSRGKFKSF